MRLLVLNPNATASITALIDAQAREAAGAGTTVLSDQPHWGASSIETAVDSHVATLAMLELLGTVPPHDGVLVSAFSDPGIAALREVIDVPVVGIGEAGIVEAASHGSFAILTVARSSVGLVDRMVADNGLEDACVGVHAAPVSVLDAASPERVRDAMVAAAHEVVAATRPSSICVGGGPLGVHAAAVAAAVGLPVVNAVHAGVRALQRRVAAMPRGNRASTYSLVERKPFVGDQPVLAVLDRLIWSPTP